MKKRKVKVIKINLDKCTGCRMCEVYCAAFHAGEKNAIINPARSRIRVFRSVLNGVFIPVIGSGYTKTECAGRNVYGTDIIEYRECVFCGASCPSRDLFKEPDSGLPLKCDMCESDPPLEEPICVQWCYNEALIYEEREVDVGEEPKLQEVKEGVKALIDKYGLENVHHTIARVTMSERI